jgi:uncharacterized protein YggE
METRTVLVGAVAVAAVLATVGAAGVVAAGGAQSTDAQPNQTVQVSASGQVQTQADRAVVRVAVVSTGDDIETVRERLSSNASSMRSALEEMGVDSGQIQTAYYDISSNRRYGGGEGDEPEYRAIHSFVVTVEDTDSVGAVIDTAVNNGASEIDGVEFTLSQDKRADLKEQALEHAMDTARGKAGAVAAAEDLTVAGVNTITTSQYSASPYRVETAVADSGGTSIDGGPVSVSATVTVVYDLSE